MAELKHGQHPSDFRADGTLKGEGFFGRIPNTVNGGPSTEISIGVDMDGVETSIPAMVPTLSQDQLNRLLAVRLGEEPIPSDIIQTAAAFARERKSKGLGFFATKKEEGRTAQPNLSLHGMMVGNPNSNPQPRTLRNLMGGTKF